MNSGLIIISFHPFSTADRALTPSIFFSHNSGDGTEKDEKLKKQQRLEAYREKRRQKEEEERRKREYHWRSQDREETVEGFEVVENFH